LLIVVCAPAIAFAAGVFIATAAARRGSTALAAVAAAAVAATAALPPSPSLTSSSLSLSSLPFLSALLPLLLVDC
jgi:hypothetical protein